MICETEKSLTQFLLTLLVSSDFGCMLSVGAIHFEERFCASRKGGTGYWRCLLGYGYLAWSVFSLLLKFLTPNFGSFTNHFCLELALKT